MKKRTREAVESILLALPCALQTCEHLTEEEKAAGWKLFEALLRNYIDDNHCDGKGAE